MRRRRRNRTMAESPQDDDAIMASIDELLGESSVEKSRKKDSARVDFDVSEEDMGLNGSPKSSADLDFDAIAKMYNNTKDELSDMQLDVTKSIKLEKTKPKVENKMDATVDVFEEEDIAMNKSDLSPRPPIGDRENMLKTDDFSEAVQAKNDINSSAEHLSNPENTFSSYRISNGGGTPIICNSSEEVVNEIKSLRAGRGSPIEETDREAKYLSAAETIRLPRKHIQGTEMRNPEDTTELRGATAKELSSMNLSQAPKSSSGASEPKDLQLPPVHSVRESKSTMDVRGSQASDVKSNSTPKLPQFSVSPDVSLSFSSFKEKLPNLDSIARDSAGNPNPQLSQSSFPRFETQNPSKDNAQLSQSSLPRFQPRHLSGGDSKNLHKTDSLEISKFEDSQSFNNTTALKTLRMSDVENQQPDHQEEIRKLQGRIEQYKKEIEEWKRIDSQSRKTIAGHEKEIAVLKSKSDHISRYEEKLADRERKIGAMGKEINSLKDQIESMVDEKKFNELCNVSHGLDTEPRPDGKDLVKLNKELRQMDILVQNLNKENHRLHQVVKMHDVTKQEAKEGFLKELGEMRKRNEELELQIQSAKGSQLRLAKELSQDEVKKLETKLQKDKRIHEKQVLELQYEIDKLRKAKLDLECKTGMESQELQKENKEISELNKRLKDLETSKTEEMNRLQQKLRWYIENQVVVDELEMKWKRDRSALNDLREKYEVLQKEKTTATETKKRGGSLKQVKRIKELEALVEDLQAMVKKKRPDSMMALIHASKPSVEEQKLVASLRNDIKTLRERLRDKERQMEGKIRSLKHMHDQSKVMYEDKIKELQKLKPKTSKKKSSREKQLEKQIAELRAYYKKKLKENPTYTGERKDARSSMKPTGKPKTVKNLKESKSVLPEGVKQTDLPENKKEPALPESRLSGELPENKSMSDHHSAPNKSNISEQDSIVSSLLKHQESLVKRWRAREAKAGIANMNVECFMKGFEEDGLSWIPLQERERIWNSMNDDRKEELEFDDFEDKFTNYLAALKWNDGGYPSSGSGVVHSEAPQGNKTSLEPSMKNLESFEIGFEQYNSLRAEDEKRKEEERRQYKITLDRIKETYNIQLQDIKKSYSNELHQIREQMEDQKIGYEAAVRGLSAKLKNTESKIETKSIEAQRCRDRCVDLEHQIMQMKTTSYHEHIEHLLQRIKRIESQHANREDQLKSQIEFVKRDAEGEIEAARQEFEARIARKDAEIRHFRRELDGMMSSIRKLRRSKRKTKKKDELLLLRNKYDTNDLDESGLKQENINDINTTDRATLAVAESLNIPAEDFSLL